MKPAARALLPLLLLLAATLWAAPPPRRPERPAPADGGAVYRRALPGVAWVEAAGQGKGTGWLIDHPRRRLITCYHVVGENKTVEVFFPAHINGAVVADRAHYFTHRDELRRSGHLTSGKVLLRRPEADLALVELDAVPEGADALPLAAARPRPGDRVHLLGCRYDVDALWSYGGGAVRQALTLREGYFNGGKRLGRGARVLLASVPINEGDSGGPLLDDGGAVVGVCAALSWEAQGSGLFIDLDEVRSLLKEDAATRPAVEPPSEEPSPGRDVYARAVRALALVRPADSNKQATAWVLDRGRRLLLTSAEIVGTRETVDVIFPLSEKGAIVADARAYRDRARLTEKGVLTVGCVLALDARRNLALLEAAALPAGADEAALADEPPRPGDALHLIGCPEKVEALWVYTAGWLRQRAHANLGQTPDGPDPAALVVQAPLSDGEAGGPVLDGRGRVVGVVAGKSGPQQQVSCCLEVEEVRGFLAENRARARPQGAAELSDRGALFTRARLYDRAIADYTEALRAEPASARACCERGRAYFLKGDAAAAERDCTRALELDPKLAAAHVHRAAARLARDEPRAALADCDRAAALDPKSAAAFSLRALARLRLGDADKARADCAEALWLDPKLATAYFHRGLIADAAGDRDAARRDYDQALRLDPRLADAWRARAGLHWARGDVKAALADYDRALELAPGDAAALRGRGRARLARGEQREALDDYRACVRLQPNRTAEVLGDLERRARDLAEVEKDPAAAAELGRAALQALRPAFRERPELDALIGRALAEAEKEADVGRRAERLRAALAELRPAAPPSG
jgi:tetratricopeptide (TPR) repeat protein/S1-C subfamily serine protease